jgi:hypothetical protein
MLKASKTNNHQAEEKDENNPAEKFSSLADILKNRQTVKAPAYPWQDLALEVIKELGIPNFKRSSVFKACRDLPAHQIKIALNDTKELCKSGAAWKYFFKIIDSKK